VHIAVSEPGRRRPSIDRHFHPGRQRYGADAAVFTHRRASATTPAVLIRQLDTIRRLAPRLPDPCRQVLSE
jgi:hypothetical protein